MDIAKMKPASYLLPDPGGEVVRELIEEIKRLREFIEMRIAKCEYIKKKCGYHGRRVSLEAAKLLAEPDYFPGKRKAPS